MFLNTLVVDSSIRKPGKSSKTAKRPAIWMGVRPGELVGLQPCSITLWWLVRVRPAPPRSRAKPEKSKFVYSRHPAHDCWLCRSPIASEYRKHDGAVTAGAVVSTL